MTTVVAVHRSGEPGFSKAPYEATPLLAGPGVEGDGHAGATVMAPDSPTAMGPPGQLLAVTTLLSKPVLNADLARTIRRMRDAASQEPEPAIAA